VRGRVEHLHNAAHQYAGPRLIYFDDGFLSGYAVVREDHPGRGVRFTGDAAKGAAFERHILDDNRQPLRWALGRPLSFTGHLKLQVYGSARGASQNRASVRYKWRDSEGDSGDIMLKALHIRTKGGD